MISVIIDPTIVENMKLPQIHLIIIKKEKRNPIGHILILQASNQNNFDLVKW